MTHGRSKTVIEFLKTAAKKRQFEVIVPESSPKGVGKYMAGELAESKIKTTLISDSAIFALMARVNKGNSKTHQISIFFCSKIFSFLNSSYHQCTCSVSKRWFIGINR